MRVGISTSAATALLVVALLAFGALALAALVMVRRRAQVLAATPWVRSALVLLFVLTTVLMVAPRGYTVKRLVMVLWPYALLILAWVFPWRSQMRSALALLLVTSLIATGINLTLVPKDNWRDLVASILAQHHAGDAVWIQPAWQQAPFVYYRSSQGTLPVSAPPTAAEQRAATLQQHARIWHVYQTADLARMDPQRTVGRWLADQMEAVNSVDFYHVHATLYQHR
jgi:hypothetical protein